MIDEQVREALDREELWPVIDYVCKRHRVSREDLLGRCRHQRIARARNDLYLVLVDTLGYSLSETGRILGRDHTTILNAVHERQRALAPIVEAALRARGEAPVAKASAPTLACIVPRRSVA